LPQEPVDHAYSAGLCVRNFSSARPDDQAGLGYGYLKEYAGLREALVEGYYNASLTPNAAVSLLLTSLLESGNPEPDPLTGQPILPDRRATVVSLRTQLNY